MEQKKVEIIKAALGVYMKFGIKSVTMDEMSNQLGVSKKTLYLHVKDKNDLVEQCLTLILDSNVCEMEKIFDKKLNAIEELLEVGRFIVKTLGAIHPTIFFDLAKFHPNVLELINDHKEKMMCMSIENNLINGKKEGLYRENLTPEIVARFHMNSMEFIMSKAFMEDTNARMDQVYAEFFRYHIRGIASEKGLECFKEIKQKMKIYKIAVSMLLTFLVSAVSFGQEKTNFSLAEAEEYGVNNNEKVKNSMLDTEIARKKVWETLAIGLPQVSAQGQFQQLLDIPVSVVDAKLFNPSAADGEVLEFRMGQEFSSSLAFNASQLIFDGSYIVGLQFTKFFEKMASTQADNSKQQVKSMVREAYYNVLVANENLVLMDSILLSTQSLWEKMKIFASNGIIKQEEADQVEIAYNRIRVSKASGERQANVALNLLKLQMGYPFEQPLTLTQTLSEILNEISGNNPLLATTSIKENQNFILLEQQKELDGFALRNEKAGYLPSVGAFFTHSQNAYRNEFDFFQNKPWYPTTIWGVSVKIPITSSGQKVMRVQQAEIKIEQDQNNLDNLEKTLQFQELQLKTSYESALEMMELEKSNVALARKIYANAIIRNETGVVSALEVTQLQNQLLSAEGNYIMTIMEMLKIKVQLDNLYNK